MEIIQANSSHKEIIMDLLDEFVFVCHEIIKTGKTVPKRDNYNNPVFDDVITSPHSAIFLAKEGNSYVGIITIHKISLIRKACYQYAEIEEMYVQEAFWGTNTAHQLLDAAINWAKDQGIISIQLKSHDLLLRAHAFYEKNNFSSYGKVFELKL